MSREVRREARVREQGKRVGRPRRTYPVEPAQIAQERAQGASWGVLASKYGLPKSSVRRLCQNVVAHQAEGQGRDEPPK